MTNNLNKFSNIYLVFSLVGFLLISVIPSLLGLSNVSYSVPYRIVVLGSSIMIILFGAADKNSIVNFKPFYLFLLFWGIYTCRIFYDLEIAGIYILHEKTNSDYLQLAFGVTFIPALMVVYTNIEKLNFEFILLWVYRILFVVLLTAIILRSGSDAAGRSAGDLEIGILLYGQYGTSLSLLSLFLLMKNKFSAKSIVYILGFIIGFITIFISASKSPFFALIFALLVFVFFRKGGVKMLLISFLIFCFFYFFFLEIFQMLNNYFPSSFLERLLYAVNEKEYGGRENLIVVGFNEFINNPFWGKAMLIQTGLQRGTYPHNLIIEAFMATGFIGGSIFTLWILKCFKSLKKIVCNNFNQSWIGLLFLQFLIFGMFSGNLFSSNLFWLSSVLLVAVSNIKISN